MSGSLQSRLKELEEIFPTSRLSIKKGDRDHHARDQSALPAHPPEAVVWPETTEEVSALLEFAQAADVPVTPWGSGTSLEGNPLPTAGGIVVDMGHMNQVLKVHAEDFQVTVQAGLRYRDMNEHLARQGLFFPPDPGANASVGGMLANNAAGIRTVRYGATRDNVLGLEVVLAGGEVIRTGTRAVKQSSGYALTDLFVGSEGTLGVITEATLQLAPVPAWVGAATAGFPSVRQAAQAVYELIGAGLGVTALELLDAHAMGILNRDSQFSFREIPYLFIEIPAPSRGGLDELLEMAEKICRANACQDFKKGLGREARDNLWQARYHIFESHQRSFPGHDYLLTDTCVPISKFAEHAAFAAQEIADSGLPGSIVCHAGDGNMHTVVFFPPDDEGARQRAEAMNGELVNHALELDGTLSGEHGIGLGKRGYMMAEHGEASLNVMRRLKAALDPHGVLNPGKIMPPVAEAPA